MKSFFVAELRFARLIWNWFWFDRQEWLTPFCRLFCLICPVGDYLRSCPPKPSHSQGSVTGPYFGHGALQRLSELSPVQSLLFPRLDRGLTGFSTALLLIGLCLIIGEERLAGATFKVVNVNDAGVGSLRQAILDANDFPGLDSIAFSIPGTGMHTIALTAGLPQIVDPVVLDGTTQPGYAGRPLVQLDGTRAGVVHGLLVLGGGSVVRGRHLSKAKA